MKSKIDSLTATRAVAAILVVIHHFGTGTFPFSYAPDLFKNGNLAVGYFFALSGFVMYHTYSTKSVPYSTFLKRRAAKIFPLYFLALFITIIIPVLTHYFHPGNALPQNLTKQILFSVTFVQAWVPNYALSLNGPGWSLSIEAFFYVFFPLLLIFQEKRINLFILFTIALYIATQAFHLHYFPYKAVLSSRMQDVVFFNPLLHLNQFLIGMLGAYVFSKTKISVATARVIAILSTVLIITLIAWRPHNISYHTGLITPLFAVFIISVALADPRLLKIKPFVLLGSASYGIYILQLPVYELFSLANNYMHISAAYFFYSYLIVLITISILCYYYIEKPMHRWINSFGKKKITNNTPLPL